MKLLKGNVAEPQGNFFGTCDAKTLSLFQNLYKMACFDERGVRPGIKPGIAAAKHFDKKIAAFQIGAINIGDFDLAPGRGFEGSGEADHIIVVKVKPGHGNVRFWLPRLFFDRKCASLVIEFHHPILLRGVDHVAEHGCPAIPVAGFAQVLSEAMTIKNVIAEDQRDPIRTDESPPDDESVCQPARLILSGKGELKTQVGA